ncbi:hypothetical protein CRI94_08130 [Longibacter salinarum]|uniref:DUF3592 domain-containing protein n=1 Tax=Longibacter salinarum TaxID=1850348 RepID=A0A2A8CZP4_9BACT|nr:hypothetical protein CRI94_08130 [Longibacter salinarum]
MTRLVARGAWIVPLFFFVIALHQSKTAVDLQATLERGTPATAEVLEVHEENRVDVTYDWISIRVPLDDGRVITKEELALPHSLIPLVADKETIDVRVNPGANQEVVITSIVNTQWRIAAMNAGIAFVAALLFGGGVWYWNRSLKEEGDPAERGVEEPDPDHPARQVAR